MSWGTAQAGNRASQTRHLLQWWDMAFRMCYRHLWRAQSASLLLFLQSLYFFIDVDSLSMNAILHFLSCPDVLLEAGECEVQTEDGGSLYENFVRGKPTMHDFLMDMLEKNLMPQT